MIDRYIIYPRWILQGGPLSDQLQMVLSSYNPYKWPKING